MVEIAVVREGYCFDCHFYYLQVVYVSFFSFLLFCLSLLLFCLSILFLLICTGDWGALLGRLQSGHRRSLTSSFG